MAYINPVTNTFIFMTSVPGHPNDSTRCHQWTTSSCFRIYSKRGTVSHFYDLTWLVAVTSPVSIWPLELQGPLHSHNHSSPSILISEALGVRLGFPPVATQSPFLLSPDHRTSRTFRLSPTTFIFPDQKSLNSLSMVFLMLGKAIPGTNSRNLEFCWLLFFF